MAGKVRWVKVGLGLIWLDWAGKVRFDEARPAWARRDEEWLAGRGVSRLGGL